MFHSDIDPSTKVVKTFLLDNWDIEQNGSNLLSIVRDVHAKFDAQPPIPEKLVQQNPSMMPKPGSNQNNVPMLKRQNSKRTENQ